MVLHVDAPLSAARVARSARVGRQPRQREIPALAVGGSARDTRAPLAPLGELIVSRDNGGLLEKKPDCGIGGSIGSPAMSLEEAKVAMAVELVGKCGSMDASWQKINLNNTGHVSRSMFDAGLSMLRIDPAEVCGLPARRLFLEMSKGGQISQDSWHKFFQTALDGPEVAAKLEDAQRRYEDAKQVQTSRPEVDESGTASARPARVTMWSASLDPHCVDTTDPVQDVRAREHPSLARRGLESGHKPPEVPAQAHDESEVVIEVKNDLSHDTVIEAHFKKLSDRDRELSTKAFISGATIAEALNSVPKFSNETVSEVEILAMAEEDTLQQELAERNLEGIKALVYIFLAKFGSMDNAFKWFDINGNVNMSNLEWDTGVKLLRIDLKKLTNTSPHEFFVSMAQGDGDISLRAWREFFALAMEEMGEELLKEAAGAHRAAPSLAERAKQRAEKLRAERLRAGGGADVERGGDQESTRRPSRRLAPKVALLTSGAHGRARAVASDGAGRDGCEAAEGAGASAVAGGGGGSGVFVDGLGELTEEEAAFLSRLRDQLGALAEGEGIEITDEAWDHRRLALTRLVASELGFYLRDLNPTGVFVGNMSNFVERTRRRLEGIEPGESLEFEKELNITQRQVVHWLAADLGLWTITQGRGASRQVVAFNVGPFAEEVRWRLQALAPGVTDRFSTGLSSVQRRIVHLIADELGLWTHSAGVGGDRYVEVFNLKAFALQVRETLEALGPGQNHDFPPTLSMEERKVVHCTATELGLVSLSQENAEGKRYVSAGNLCDFRGQVRNQMEQMDKGESKAIQASGWGTAKFTMLQLEAIKLAASDMGMSQSEDGGGGEQLQVTSARPGASTGYVEEAAKAPEVVVDARHDAEKDGGRKKRRSSSKERRACTKAASDEADEMADFFDEMCTGSYNGQKLFTSLLDLKALLNELREVMPVRQQRVKKEWARLESLFEDTVQLQVDFGTRTRKGLTYQWFQTFIQKVARHFGMSVMGLLLLLNPDLD